MRRNDSKEKAKRAKPGPKPEILKIKGDWQKAVTRSFRRKKPPSGWPK
jgi:hypothetical protein